MNSKPPSLVRIGIDTGGTFTDVVSYDTTDDRLLFLKIHSTPDDPGRALVQGVQEASNRLECGVEGIDLLAHGTTVAT